MPNPAHRLNSLLRNRKVYNLVLWQKLNEKLRRSGSGGDETDAVDDKTEQASDAFGWTHDDHPSLLATFQREKKITTDADDTTDWRSLSIASAIALFTAIQFTIYFASLWPYLLQLDPDASEGFFGWIIAVYSLAQAMMCVAFGYWQNRIGQSRIPILAGALHEECNDVFTRCRRHLVDLKMAAEILHCRNVGSPPAGVMGRLHRKRQRGGRVDRTVVLNSNGRGSVPPDDLSFGFMRCIPNYAPSAILPQFRDRAAFGTSMTNRINHVTTATGEHTVAFLVRSPKRSYGFRYESSPIAHKLPLLALTMTGNCLYMLCAVTPISPKWMMMISRCFTGLGAGMITVLRTYAVNASTPSNRARSIALNAGCFSLGITIGPAIQIIFSPLGYPGFKLAGSLNLDMYTAPAFMGIVVNAISACLVVFVFRESSVGVSKKIITENEDHVRFFALPQYDRWAITICILTRFAQMFVITNLETLGAPISLNIFGWNKQETVQYNSLMHGGFGFISFVIYAFSVYYDVGKMINHRIGTCVGMLALVLFHVITFPWWGLSGTIPYQQEFATVNGTLISIADPVGCRPSFEWCSTTPPMNPVLFVVAYILIVGPAFSIINVSMNTVFSTLIGPRNQGTMQGVLLLSGSMARMCGPIFVA
ncbi:unnamed protein product [Nippostrongylus brasiliensis]|uniref:MFS domain-containing protein n=1 Tax=Nippostrongylus brasiliensis TaxID=27835 RepID=A0A158QZL6_NIPBR|nr:unnamed protein product [Nippostrongylus brasiliensis]